MKILLLIALALPVLAEDKKPDPTIEQLQARIVELEKKLVQAEKQLQLELLICMGALNGARQAALAEPSNTQKPMPPKSGTK